MNELTIPKRKRTLLFDLEKPAIPMIFGILNLSTDSFSDGSRYLDPETALTHARSMLHAGAFCIDIGAESTRPGALELDHDLEISRVVPVVQALRAAEPDCLISIDTRKADVAEAALTAGADIINDVSGLQFDPALAGVVVHHGAGLVLMHMRGTPETMQSPENLRYTDLVGEVLDFFRDALRTAESAGIPRTSILLDPGVGFSKTVEQNLTLIREIDRFRELGRPLFYGISRKSFIGKITGVDLAAERDFGTAGVLAFLALKQAEFVRVHQVAAARDSMKMALCCAGKIKL